MAKLSFTVYRDRWARGGINGLPALLNEQGGMCCLGFACVAAGATPEQVIEATFPYVAVERGAALPGLEALWCMSGSDAVRQRTAPTTISDQIGLCNDDDFLEDSERESQLTELFASIDMEIKFEDTAPPEFVAYLEVSNGG